MSPGKLAAQAGHAFTEVLKAIADWDNEQILANHAQYLRESPGTKVVLYAKDLAELDFVSSTLARFVPTAVVEDSGHIILPHFDGTPVITALGIGPATRDQVDFALRRLALVR